MLRRRRVLHFDLRVLLVTVPAFFIVYYALIGLVGQHFSPSLLPAQGHLAGTLVRYGLAATVVQLLANLWALRNKPTLANGLASANGIAWVGLLLAMLPAGLAWAFYPPPYVTLPGPVWLVMIPAVEVAVACAAVTFRPHARGRGRHLRVACVAAAHLIAHARGGGWFTPTHSHQFIRARDREQRLLS